MTTEQDLEAARATLYPCSMPDVCALEWPAGKDIHCPACPQWPVQRVAEAIAAAREEAGTREVARGLGTPVFDKAKIGEQLDRYAEAERRLAARGGPAYPGYFTSPLMAGPSLRVVLAGMVAQGVAERVYMDMYEDLQRPRWLVASEALAIADEIIKQDAATPPKETP